MITRPLQGRRASLDWTAGGGFPHRNSPANCIYAKSRNRAEAQGAQGVHRIEATIAVAAIAAVSARRMVSPSEAEVHWAC